MLYTSLYIAAQRRQKLEYKFDKAKTKKSKKIILKKLRKIYDLLSDIENAIHADLSAEAEALAQAYEQW